MVDKVLFSSNSECWITPIELYDKLNEEFKFDLDPCTTEDNPLGTKYYFTKEDDGLKSDWPKDVTSVFINPPYNQEIKKWLEKAISELKKGGNVKNIVFLLPARTDTKWMHDYIYTNPNAHIRFLKGRLKFRGAKNSAPFPSMLCIFSKQ